MWKNTARPEWMAGACTSLHQLWTCQDDDSGTFHHIDWNLCHGPQNYWSCWSECKSVAMSCHLSAHAVIPCSSNAATSLVVVGRLRTLNIGDFCKSSMDLWCKSGFYNLFHSFSFAQLHTDICNRSNNPVVLLTYSQWWLGSNHQLLLL